MELAEMGTLRGPVLDKAVEDIQVITTRIKSLMLEGKKLTFEIGGLLIQVQEDGSAFFMLNEEDRGKALKATGSQGRANAYTTWYGTLPLTTTKVTRYRAQYTQGIALHAAGLIDTPEDVVPAHAQELQRKFNVAESEALGESKSETEAAKAGNDAVLAAWKAANAIAKNAKRALKTADISGKASGGNGPAMTRVLTVAMLKTATATELASTINDAMSNIALATKAMHAGASRPSAIQRKRKLAVLASLNLASVVATEDVVADILEMMRATDAEGETLEDVG